MFKYFLSALLISILLFSNLVNARTKKCPVRIPDSLVSLYVKSDLIVFGELKSEKVEKVLAQTDTYSTLLIKQTLQVSKTLKGVHSPTIFTFRNEYRAKQKDDEINEFLIDDEEFINFKIGDKALFFLSRDNEKQLRLIGFEGLKKLDNASLNVYKKRIKELDLIVKTKKNQTENLAEWFVKCAEEPATRWEGLYELNRSLNELKYEIEEDEEDEEETQVKSNKTEEKTEIIGTNYFNNTSEIAKKLTASQKDRLIAVFYNQVLENMANSQKEDFVSENYDWQLSELASNLDKFRALNFLHSNLQNVGVSNKSAAVYLMQNITEIVDDEEFYELYQEFNNIKTKKDDEIFFKESTENKEPENITFKQLRQEILDKFNARYQKLLANNFEPIANEEEIIKEEPHDEQVIIDQEKKDNRR
jgi:hypothetical protein